MLQRKTPLKAKTQLQSKKPMSKKRSKRARAKEFSPKVRAEIIERDSGLCVRCGRVAAHIHHIRFRSQQGSGDKNNGCCVCLDCHNLAHTKREVREWFEQLAAGREVNERD